MTLPFVRPLRQLSHMVPRLGPKLAMFLATSLGAAAAEAVMLLLIAKIATAVTGNTTTLSLGPLDGLSVGRAFAVTAAAVVVRLGLGLTQSWVAASFATSVLLHARRRVIEAQAWRNWDQEAERMVGADQDLLNSAAPRVANWAAALGQLVLAAISVTVLTVAAISANVLAFVAMASAGLVILLLRPLTRRTKRWSAAFGELNQRLVEMVADRSGAALEIRAYDVAKPVADELLQLNSRTRHSYLRTRIAGTASPQLFQAATLLTLVGTLAAVHLTTDSSSSSLGAVALMMLRSLSYGQQVSTALHALAEHRPYVDQLGGRPPEAPSTETTAPLRTNLVTGTAPGAKARAGAGAGPAGAVAGTVEVAGATAAPVPSPLAITPGIAFDRVSFSYPAGRPVLEDCSFRVVPGEMFGVIGPSGAGKTTLVQLLLGLRAPTGGAILLDGVDRATMSRATWATQIAFVAQEPRLIAGTVSQNIAFFRPHGSAAVIEAARRGLIHDEITTWPEGYDTEIGERGRQVSGGQRQRIAIARALVGNPRLLVLDEPTSALDAASEAAIGELLQRLRGEVTVVVVTHRATTASRCDRLLQLERGKLRCLPSSSPA